MKASSYYGLDHKINDHICAILAKRNCKCHGRGYLDMSASCKDFTLRWRRYCDCVINQTSKYIKAKKDYTKKVGDS